MHGMFADHAILHEIKHYIELVEAPLALAAIIFAIKQFFDARDQFRKMEEIVRSMTTRYVEMFPDNFNELTHLVALPKKTLDVMMDYAGYGHYSDPEEFERYLNEIRMTKSKPRLKKRLLIYSSSLTKQIFLSREFTEEVWQKLRSEKRYSEFFAHHCPTPCAEPATLAEFRKVMLSNLGYYLFEMQKADFEIRTVRVEQAVFLWKVDDLDAMVTFRSQRSDDQEAAFRTRDTKLLMTLSTLFNNVWEVADPLPQLRNVPEEWGVNDETPELLAAWNGAD